MLHFYYGVMGSSKTAMLLMQRYNYIAQGLRVALVKPAVDTRIDHNTVYSRVGLNACADIVLEPGHSIREQLYWLAVRNGHNDFPYVFVDEHLLAFLDDVSLAVNAGVHGGFAAAPAQAAGHFAYILGQTQECGGAGEEIALEVRFQAVTEKLMLIGHVGHFLHLLFGEELRLIDNQQEIKYIGLCYKHWKLGESHGPVSE